MKEYIPSPAPASMTDFERQIVEQGFRLLPMITLLCWPMNAHITCRLTATLLSEWRHRFRRTVRIRRQKANSLGFSETLVDADSRSPISCRRARCAGYITWIYAQLGYTVPSASTSFVFFSRNGHTPLPPRIRDHLVIPSLEQAMIGDSGPIIRRIYSYKAGMEHTQLYLGTGNRLGIADALLEIYPDFLLTRTLC